MEVLKILGSAIPCLRFMERDSDLKRETAELAAELERCRAALDGYKNDLQKLSAALDLTTQERDGYKNAYEVVCTDLSSTQQALTELQPDGIAIVKEAALKDSVEVRRVQDTEGLLQKLEEIVSRENLPDSTAKILLDPQFSIEDRSRYRSLFADRRLEKWSGIARAVAHIVNTQNVEYSARSDSPDKAEAIANELEHQGLVRLAPALSADQIAEIQQYFLDRPVLNGHIPTTARHRTLRRYVGHTAEDYPIGCYPVCDIVNAPYLLELAFDPLILDAAAKYFGCAPRITFLQTWWNFSSEDGPSYSYGQNRFHRDESDAKMFWLYVYLTDVEVGCGEHRIIRQSGNFDEVRSNYERVSTDPQWSKEFEGYKLEDFYGPSHSLPENLKLALFPSKEEIMTGPAGTMFLSRGIDYHKVSLPSTQRRMIFAARFCLNDFLDTETNRDGDRMPGSILARRVGSDEQLRYMTKTRFDWKNC
ncbi:MAG: hypothetical protein K2W95_14340 [Candidatus Obscuribacterales bacterium]|nr:hypothetical protein [Candidatus Obscuribacterales bacterium]